MTFENRGVTLTQPPDPTDYIVSKLYSLKILIKGLFPTSNYMELCGLKCHLNKSLSKSDENSILIQAVPFI